MKICIASLAPFIGGAEIAMKRLAIGLMDRGHSVVCALGAKNEVSGLLTQSGVRWVHYSMPHTDKLRWPVYWNARRKFRQFLRRENVDILHCNDLPSFQMPSDSAYSLGIKRVCHHRFVFDAEAIQWFVRRPADCHVFVSDGLGQDLFRIYPGLRDEPWVVNHDGLALPELISKDGKREMVHTLGLPKDKVLVLFAGQIIERKGVQYLIHAWRRLAPELREKAHLIFIGDDLAGRGAYQDKMKKLAAELGVEADFRGFQNNVDEWLGAADVVCVPSLMEPLGNAVLEAMAHGKPVIGSRVGGIPEMIKNRDTGFLVPPEDKDALSGKLAVLISNLDMREAMGVSARKKCESEFNLDAHARRAESLYQKLLGRSSKGNG